VLHITNGQSAASVIRAARLPGDVLCWDDVLHEGPVPEDVSFNQLRAIRARFIADCGWATFEDALQAFAERNRALERSLQHDEVVLWFEHDLYDQLQLIQLLDWYATCEIGSTRLSLVCDAEYLGPSPASRIAERFPGRRAVTESDFDLARAAWRAFRSTNPREIERVIGGDTRALPFLAAALHRHLEEYPSTENGLSRTERQALDALVAAPMAFRDLNVAAHQRREDPVYMGDTSFALHLAAMSNVPHPLLLTTQGAHAGPPATLVESAIEFHITDTGRRVLE
jgi:hypothetical protein